MKGSEAKMIEYMEGAGKRYVIPVYQRKYDWKEDNCRQLYEDLKKIVRDNRESHFFGMEDPAVLLKPPFDRPVSFVKLFGAEQRQKLLGIVKKVRENAEVVA